MKNILLLAFVSILLTSSSPNQTRPRIFEVRVEARINNCNTRHTVEVEAKNIFDARQRAQRIVQHRLNTRVTGSKEITRR